MSSPADTEPVSSEPLAREFPLSSWLRRAVAWILDAFVVAIPYYLVTTLTGLIGTQTVKVVSHHVVPAGRTISIGRDALLAAIWIILHALYYGLTEGRRRGQTFGKRSLGIATVDQDTGDPIGFLRAAGRSVISNVLLYAFLLPGVVNGLWPLYSERRQAWHDRAMRTVVLEVLPA